MIEVSRRARMRPCATASGWTAGAPANVSAALVVIVVVPLALLQVPNLIALAVPGMRAIGSVSRSEPELVRAAGLALPAMLFAAPTAALAARRARAWPVLLVGLTMLGLADVGANLPAPWAHMVRAVAVDRAAHGLGAGTALAGCLALVWERPGLARRMLACLWSAAAVATLMVSVPLIGSRVAAGGWRAALQPYPWLTGAALAATAAHVALTGSTRGAMGGGRAGATPSGHRRAVTAAERAQFALLAVPAAGTSALAVGSTYGWPPSAQLAAGSIAAVLLTLLAVTLTRDPAVGCSPNLAVAALAVGLVIGPSAGVAQGLHWLMVDPGTTANGAGGWSLAATIATAAAAGCGAFIAGKVSGVAAAATCSAPPSAPWSVPWSVPCSVARRRGTDGPRRRGTNGPGGGIGALPAQGMRRCCARVEDLAVATGLDIVAAGLLVARICGSPAPPGLEVAQLALVAAGAALALGAALAGASASASLAALPVGLAGVMTGYLVAGALQIRLLAGLAGATALGEEGRGWPAAAPVRGTLAHAADTWELVAAGAAVLAAITVLLAARACRGGTVAPSAG